MSDSSAPARRRPAVALVVAALLFLAGVGCVVVGFVDGFSGATPPGMLRVGVLAAPLGFAVAIGYALYSGRRARRKD